MQYGYRGKVVATLAWLGALALTACGGPSNSSPVRPGPQAGQQKLVAPPAAALTLPFPTDRGTSELTETIIAGKDALEHSVTAVEFGTALQLPAAANHAGYAIYRFNSGPTPPVDAQVLLEAGATEQAYIALANFSRQRWSFFGPTSTGQTLVLDDADYVSPNGNVYVAVLAPAGTTAQVNQVAVRTVKPANQLPLAAFTPSVAGGTAPLPVSFDAGASSDPDGQLVEYAWDWDGDGIYDELTATATSQHTFGNAGQISVGLRVTDDQFAQATATKLLVITPAPNELPAAAFTLSKTSGRSPLTVDLDAGQSLDPDGAITNYEWDWDEDLVYDYETTEPTASHVFTGYGPLTVGLRVTDSNGAQAETTRNLTLNGWSLAPQPLATGTSPSMAMVAGKPAAAFFTSTSNISYVRATADDGSSWAPVVSASNKPCVDIYGLSLCEVNGCPAILFGRDSIWYVRATDSAGTSWGTPLEVSGDEFCAYCSLAIVDGKPAAAWSTYHTFGGGEQHMFYSRATDVDGTSWSAPIEPELGVGGADPHLQVVNGNPAIAFCDQTGGGSSLRYVRASDLDGTTWGTGLTLDPQLFSGYGACIQIVDGYPSISYGELKSLRYIRALDADGASWSSIQQLASGDFNGQETSMEIIDGVPVIGFAIAGQAKVIKALDSTGALWDTPQSIGPHTGYAAPSLLSGPYPQLMYSNNTSLMLAREF